jgi:pimeloyl-ACP methyl ester carboxylesterase
MDSSLLEKKAVIIAGHRVWFRTRGTGIPLLMLAGWGASTERYFPLQDKLSGMGYKVVLPDLPGLPGRTASVRMGLQEWTDWIQELVTATIGEPFVLVSHSLSSRIAMQYISVRHPDCRGCIFISPWLVSSSCGALLWRWIAEMVRLLCPLVYQDMSWVKDDKAWATAIGLISAIRDASVIPCLVLWGRRDLARRLFGGWKGLHCEGRQPNWDHSPQVRATDELAAAIDTFARQRFSLGPPP